MPLEATEAPEHPTRIDAPYLLVTHIPVLSDEEGRLWVGRLWYADLARHVAYLPRLKLAAPVRGRGAESDLVRLDPLVAKGLVLCALPAMDTRLQGLLQLPRTSFRLWRAMAGVEIVHSSMGGWPFPLALIALPLARLRRRLRIVVVESAPWRILGSGRRWSLLRRLYSAAVEAAARRLVAHSDLALFTHVGYRRSLDPGGVRHAHVLPASWLPDETVLSEAAAHRIWQAKLVDRREPRILFAGRLSVEKGVEILLDALRVLDREGVAGRVDILGEGPLREACQRAAAELGSLQVAVHAPLPYGEPFFAFLRGYHAVVLPTLSDEQPRIIFDSYSQALPLLAAATPGIRPHVTEGVTGWLLPPGDVRALAQVLQRAVGDPASLHEMGMSALPVARSLTHSRMHARRSRLIAELLACSAR